MRAVDVLVCDDDFVFCRENTQLPPGLCVCTHPVSFLLDEEKMAQPRFLRLDATAGQERRNIFESTMLVRLCKP
jgi:hypothetical protein